MNLPQFRVAQPYINSEFVLSDQVQVKLPNGEILILTMQEIGMGRFVFVVRSEAMRLSVLPESGNTILLEPVR